MVKTNNQKQMRAWLFFSNLTWLLVVFVLVFTQQTAEKSLNNTANATKSSLDQKLPNQYEVELSETTASSLSFEEEVTVGDLSQLEIESTVYSAESMQDAVTVALNKKDPIARSAEFYNLLTNLSLETVPGALTALESIGYSQENDALIRSFMVAWVRIDGASAMDYALNVNEDRKFYARHSDDQIIEEWARHDPQAAIAYLQEVEKSGNRDSLHHHIVKGLSQTDLDAAARYAEENQRSEARGRSVNLLAEAYMKRGGVLALKNWLNGIDQDGGNDRDSFKQYALARATMEIAKEDSTQAKALVDEFAKEGMVDGRALRYVAERTAGSNPSETVNWLLEYPEGRARSRAIATAIGQWADQDPNEAGAWLNSQEESPDMDQAISTFARGVAQDDPAVAMGWGESIKNERMRLNTMIRIGNEWLKQDQASLRSWLEQDNVPAEVRFRFERVLREQTMHN